MKKYSEYISKKDNQWFDNVPINWEIIALKHLTYYVKTGSTPSTKERKYYDEGNIDWYTPEDINSLILNDSKKKISNKAIEDGELKLFKANSLLLVGIGATIGKVGLLTKNATSNQQINSIFFNKKLIPKFGLYYFYSIAKIINDFSSTSTMGIFNQSKTKAIYVPVPSKSEQLTIVQFLDYKTKLIDDFIANRQRQIELLKEQLRKKTYNALTKGLKQNEYKTTSLPWFTEIPKNWEMYKFNAAVKLLHGFQFRDNHFREKGVKVVKITQLKADGSLDLSEASFVDDNFLKTLSNKKIKNGDILMALTGGTIGKIIRVEGLEEEAMQNYRVGKFLPKDEKKLDKDFMFWVLSSEFTYAQILFLQRETGQPNIGISDFSKMFFPLPDTLEEQKLISTYIKKIKTETDEIVSKYQKQIDLMQEYRTSLISQTVTGKINVRDWKPKNN